MRVIAYAVAAALLFAGCTQPEPKEPKASSTPTVTAPSIPPAAQEDSEAGAIAFVKHYIDVFNYASNTGDVKELKKLSDPQCEGCNSYIELYEKTYADGGYFRDSDWSISEAFAEIQGKLLLVFADMNSPAGTSRTSSTSKVQKDDPQSAKLAFVVDRHSAAWSISEFERQKGSK